MTTHTIEMYDPPDAIDICNADRAEMVRPLVDAFQAAYYHGPESTGTVIADMIADLLHLVDTFDDDGFDTRWTADEIIASATGHYDAEVSEETELQEGP
jgi:hypothetical protein